MFTQQRKCKVKNVQINGASFVQHEHSFVPEDGEQDTGHNADWEYKINGTHISEDSWWNESTNREQNRSNHGQLSY